MGGRPNPNVWHTGVGTPVSVSCCHRSPSTTPEQKGEQKWGTKQALGPLTPKAPTSYPSWAQAIRSNTNLSVSIWPKLPALLQNLRVTGREPRNLEPHDNPDNSGGGEVTPYVLQVGLYVRGISVYIPCHPHNGA